MKISLLFKTFKFISAACSIFFLLGCSSSDEPAPTPHLESKAAALRGQEIVEGFGACGLCHSKNGTPNSPLSGGRVLTDKYGEFIAPNITLGEGGLSDYTQEELWKIFRGYKDKDDRGISKDAHFGFQWLSDRDLAGIITYLRTLPPRKAGYGKRSITFIGRNTKGFLDADREVKGYVPEIPSNFQKEYGKYIAEHVARCSACHDSEEKFFSEREYWQGGKVITFDGVDKIAPNITNSVSDGIGTWSEDDIRQYLVSGKTPSGGKIDSKFCPVDFFSHAPTTDINAVAAYAKTVSPSE